MTIEGNRPFEGVLRVPGDKSISHRAVLLAALAEGESELFGLGLGHDVQSTIGLIDALGIEIEVDDFETYFIQGCGGKAPLNEIAVDCGNSGTTARIGMGLLAGLGVTARLNGDESLQRRPMRRVADPLAALGANVDLSAAGTLPALLNAATMRPGEIWLDGASAQVSSAVAFAGLSIDGTTIVHAPGNARDHTQRMFQALNLELDLIDDGFTIDESFVPAFSLDIAGDPSSAAFFLTGAAFTPESECVIEGMCLNPTRTAFLDVLEAMGARVTRTITEVRLGEPVGDVEVGHGELNGVDIDPELVPALIDEIPVLAVAAAFALGETNIRGAADLANKESNRLETTAALVRSLGATCEVFDDGLRIVGASELPRSIEVDAVGDHRIAMAAAIAGCGLAGTSTVHNSEVIAVSYPNFFSDLNNLRGHQLEDFAG